MISAVIPTYNEEKAIKLTIDGIRDAFATADVDDFEIIVVDDGSSDESAKIAEDCGARVFRNPTNRGYGRSLKNGILIAKGETIFITDADGTYPAEYLPQLLERYRNGHDLVVGQRTGEHYKESPLKWPLRLTLRFLVEFASGQSIPDINSGMRLFHRKTILRIMQRLSNRFSFTTSMTLIYLLQGLSISYVPIPYHPRIGQTRVNLFRDALRTLQFIVSAIGLFNPIKLFLVIAAFPVGLAILAFLSAIFIDGLTPLWVGFICLSVAALIFALGLVADVLRQLFPSQSLFREDFDNEDG